MVVIGSSLSEEKEEKEEKGGVELAGRATEGGAREESKHTAEVSVDDAGTFVINSEV
jgi:hypothetical protein